MIQPIEQSTSDIITDTSHNTPGGGGGRGRGGEGGSVPHRIVPELRHLH